MQGNRRGGTAWGTYVGKEIGPNEGNYGHRKVSQRRNVINVLGEHNMTSFKQWYTYHTTPAKADAGTLSKMEHELHMSIATHCLNQFLSIELGTIICQRYECQGED